MQVEIAAGKVTLTLANPVIGGAGAFGFGGEYSRLVALDKLGALITNPVSWGPRRAARGTRVVALDSGVLIHNGLPNPGIHKAFRQYAARWKHMPIPVLMHVLGTSPADVAECAGFLDRQEEIAGLEIGLHDGATHRDARLMIGAARARTQLPILARLPMAQAPQITALASAAVEAGADALVIAAPPRGTARDPISGQLVGGRVYAPWVKTLALRAVGQVASSSAGSAVPLIGAGGVHRPQDARDYLEAGAKAVQIDSVVWVRPGMVESIVRNLSGAEMTRAVGALEDEWYPGEKEPSASTRAMLYPSTPPPSSAPQFPPDSLPE